MDSNIDFPAQDSVKTLSGDTAVSFTTINTTFSNSRWETNGLIRYGKIENGAFHSPSSRFLNLGLDCGYTTSTHTSTMDINTTVFTRNFVGLLLSSPRDHLVGYFQYILRIGRHCTARITQTSFTSVSDGQQPGGYPGGAIQVS